MSTSGCPASAPFQFLEHNRPFSTNTINISWTAPATDAGGVTIYVAANAANNNGNDTGDHIYTTSLKLTPAGSSAPKPQISSGGVVSAGAFKATESVAPGGWIEIFGSNLASTTRGWAGSDFNGSVAPTALDGVSVTVGGRNAYVAFVSPTQVNALVPDGVPIGTGVPVVVKSGGTESDPAPLNTADVAPAILAPPSFSVGGRQYVAAIVPSSDGSIAFAGPAGAIAGANLRPARPGEVITLYGIGFGPVSPASAAGSIASQLASIANNVTVQVGGVPATVQYAGLAPGFVGLYQLNVQVPNVGSGDQPLIVSLNGTPVAKDVLVSIAQ